jgi:hypothetical protein
MIAGMPGKQQRAVPAIAINNEVKSRFIPFAIVKRW